ncbi:MAG TPA: hypothetical protein VG164_00340 [Trebonia sp.]|jgi:uncharacterized protein YukE|nr:hypothetical protein [Trebonia sp.]
MSGNWGTGTGPSPGPGGAGTAGLTALIDIKTEAVTQSDVSALDAGQIMDILHGLDADGVLAAAQAHLTLSDKLQQVATRLAGNAHTLAQSWQGTAAQAAMVKFQQMHDQTATLAAQAEQTGQVLHWLGTEVLPKYKALPDPRVESRTASDEQTGGKVGGKVAGAPGALIGDFAGGVASMLHIGSNGQAKADAQARQYLTALNEHLIQANGALPSPIGAPASRAIGGGSPSPTRGPGAGGASVPLLTPVAAGGRTGTVGGAHGAGPLAAGRPGTATLAHGGAGAGGAGLAPGGDPKGLSTSGSLPGNPASSLQGFPVTGGPAPSGSGTPGPVLTQAGPGPSTPMPGLPVPGGYGSGGGNGGGPADGDLPADGALPGEAGAGGMADEALPGLEGAGAVGVNSAADGAVAGTLGTAADGTADAGSASALGAGDAADSGMAAFPFGGAGAGQPDRERRRQAWMDEDEDIWGLPVWLVPAVIEGGG